MERKKKTDEENREKQGKDILPSLPAGAFPRSERLGQLEFARTFFSLVHKTSSQNAAVSLFSLFACLFHFRLWEVILEAGTGDFNSCSSSRLGG